MTHVLPALWRIASIFLAGTAGLAAFFSFALGSCHSAGGFCATSFGADNVANFAIAISLAPVAGVLAVLPFRRTAVAVVVAALVPAVLMLVLVALVWPR